MSANLDDTNTSPTMPAHGPDAGSAASPHGDGADDMQGAGDYLKVDIQAGGHAGSYCRAFVWAPAYNLGRGFNDTEDLYEQVAKLLDSIEQRTGRRCVTGEVRIKWDEQAQGDMALDDVRIDPPVPKKRPSQSQAARQGKRHSQQHSTPGSHED